MIATASGLAASVGMKLPPSVRDFDIYRFVKVECHSTRAAARELSREQLEYLYARAVRAFKKWSARTCMATCCPARRVFS
jgi:hypothetical protein